MVKAKKHIEMPLLFFGDHYVTYLWEFGPTIPGGMGRVEVSFLEMEAWERKVGIELAPWEAKLLRRLSCDYLAESYKAKDIDAVPPYQDAIAAAYLKRKRMNTNLDLFLG